jgi:hypothetical protein
MTPLPSRPATRKPSRSSEPIWRPACGKTPSSEARRSRHDALLASLVEQLEVDLPETLIQQESAAP